MRITPAGRKLLAVGTPAARKVHEELMLRISGPERETFLNVLSAMALNLGQG